MSSVWAADPKGWSHYQGQALKASQEIASLGHPVRPQLPYWVLKSGEAQQRDPTFCVEQAPPCVPAAAWPLGLSFLPARTLGNEPFQSQKSPSIPSQFHAQALAVWSLTHFLPLAPHLDSGETSRPLP